MLGVTLQREAAMNIDVVTTRFEEPDERREMELGGFEIVRLGGMTIGRATYKSGWKWSVHVATCLGLATRTPISISARRAGTSPASRIRRLVPGATEASCLPSDRRPTRVSPIGDGAAAPHGLRYCDSLALALSSTAAASTICLWIVRIFSGVQSFAEARS